MFTPDTTSQSAKRSAIVTGHKANTTSSISASSVHHWLHNCLSPSDEASNLYPSFPFNEPGFSHNDQHKDHHHLHLQPHQHHGQQKQDQHAQSVQPYSPHSHILDDSDKALLATIQLGPGSTDRILSSQTTNTTTAANSQQTLMYSIPALLSSMENSHPSADWQPKQQQHHLQPPQPTGGRRSPFVRHLTPMTELDSVSSSGHSNNGNDDSHLLNSYMSDNHNHHHHALYYAKNNSSNPTVILPDQGTPPHHHHHPSSMTYNHHRQYGAVDGLSAALLHLTHLHHPLSLSPSASPPDFPGSPYYPSGTPLLSSYPLSSAAPSLDYTPPYHPNPYSQADQVTFGGLNEPTFLGGSNYGMYSPNWSRSRPLSTRLTPVARRRSLTFLEKQCIPMSSSTIPPSLPQSSIMTRCRSQALLGQNALHSVSKKMTVPSMVTKPKPLPFARLSTSKSSLSVSVGGARSSTTSPSSPLNPSNSVVTMTPRPSSSSSGYTPLICEICKKEYANNSTLRRHGKIHAYANASSAARKICKPRPSSTPISPSAGPIGIADNSAMSSLVHGDNGSLAAGLNSGGVSTISSTLAAVNTHLLSSFWPYRDSPAPALPNNLMTAASSSVSGSMTGNATTSGQLLQGAAAAAEMMIMPGYNPGYDPTIKKPECIGCNKPFARRDTVILHIKNQKRKWDLLCAMLPTLAASASSTSSISHTHGSGSSVDGGDASDGDADDGDNDDAASSNSRYRRTSSGSKGGKLASTAAHRRSVRQKKAHPFRVAEKLWQSTLQKKKIQFGAYKKTPPTVTSTTTVTAMSMTTVKRASATESAGHGRKSLSSSSFGYGGDDDDEFDDNMHVDEHRRHLHQNHSEEDMEIMNAYMEADDDDEKDDGDEDEDGWPSEEALEEMDNATKIRWMMRMAVVPPCWSERKVRIFGVQGEVEEAVLQDG